MILFLLINHKSNVDGKKLALGGMGLFGNGWEKDSRFGRKKA